MSKKSIKSPKAYKSLLGRLYVILIIIISASGAAYYILALNSTLSQLYQPENTNTQAPQPILQNVNPNTEQSLKSLKESKDAKSESLSDGVRVNPFN